MPFKSLQNLLNPNDDGELGNIIRHAQDMGELIQILQEALPGESQGSICAANIRDNGELVILASSPAWAAKLRFDAECLMQAARNSGAAVSICKVRVNRGS